MSWRGIFVGSLALLALQLVVTKGGSSRVAGLFAVPANVAARFLDPTIPAIPDRRTGGQVGGPWSRPSTASSSYPNPTVPPRPATT